MTQYTKFNQKYEVLLGDGGMYSGVGIGSICGITNKDYLTILYDDNITLVEVEKTEKGLVGQIIDWSVFGDYKEPSNENKKSEGTNPNEQIKAIKDCREFCEYLLRKKGLLEKTLQAA